MSQTIVPAPAYPLPRDLRDAVRITWHLSNWCNYQCDYCGVPVFSQRSSSPQEHCFDHHSVDAWLSAFARMPQSRVLLKILGGEPFMDRRNWRILLAGLLSTGRFKLDVFSNASWNASYYEDLPNLSDVRLALSFHPTQTEFAPWRERVLRIRDTGFTITRAIFVLAPENLEAAEQFQTQMERDGVLTSMTVMFNAGLYMHKKQVPEEAVRLARTNLTPAAAWMEAIGHRTRGMDCYYPATNYDLDYAGSIQVSCLGGEKHDFINGSLPSLPRETVSCPLDDCLGCFEMSYMVRDNPFRPDPVRLFDDAEFAAEVRLQQSRIAEDPDYFENELRRARMPHSDTDCYSALVSRTASAPPPPAIDIPLDAIVQPVPAVPAFGYLDSQVVRKRATERVLLSGWAFTTDPLGPPPKVHIEMAGRRLGAFEDFFPRPEVARLFGKSELLTVGFQGLVFLPGVRPGEYEITAIVEDRAGGRHPLPPLPVTIEA